MNVFPITSVFPFQLNEQQQQFCRSDERQCLAYINSTDIKVTTCGTRIDGDGVNVFPQKDLNQVKLIERLSSPTVEVHGTINGNPVIASANRELMKKQNIMDFCLKRDIKFDDLDVSKRFPYTEYSMCKHVKLVVNSKDITLAR
jgi:hypothetical protein